MTDEARNFPGGNYMNLCNVCAEWFLGPKRQFTCRICQERFDEVVKRAQLFYEQEQEKLKPFGVEMELSYGVMARFAMSEMQRGEAQ